MPNLNSIKTKKLPSINASKDIADNANLQNEPSKLNDINCGGVVPVAAALSHALDMNNSIKEGGVQQLEKINHLVPNTLPPP